MADPTTASDPPVEAVAVAQLLGCAPEQLTGIKLLVGDDVYPPPDLPGFTRSPGVITFTTKGGWKDTRGIVRYDSPDGPLIVVPHENGSEIRVLVGHASQIVGLLGGITGLITFANSQRRPHRTGDIRRRRNNATGELSAQAPRNETTHNPDNTDTSGKPA